MLSLFLIFLSTLISFSNLQLNSLALPSGSIGKISQNYRETIITLAVIAIFTSSNIAMTFFMMCC